MSDTEYIKLKVVGQDSNEIHFRYKLRVLYRKTLFYSVLWIRIRKFFLDPELLFRIHTTVLRPTLHYTQSRIHKMIK